MALNLRSHTRLLFHRTPCLRCLYSTPTTPPTPPAPPLLLKFRGDLKDAMRTKDTSRLNVLKGLLSDITNASKTKSPIRTDMQVLSLLRKRSAAGRLASAEFAAANRQDLKTKEDEQVGLLEGYAGGVEMVEEEEVRRTAEEMMHSMDTEGVKVDKGSLIRRLVGEGGALTDKAVDRGMVSRVVQDVLGGDAS